MIKNITALDRLSGKWFVFEIGENVIKIEEHRNYLSEGDKWFYDVIYKDGSVVRLFEVSAVYYVEE